MRFLARYTAIIFFLFFIQNINCQCVSQVMAFKPGEKVTYLAYYNWLFVWLHAGDIQFTVNQKSYLNKQVYSFEAIGNSREKYDGMYKVRDRFRSYVDMETFNPMWAERNTSEGSYKAYESLNFSMEKHKIFSSLETSETPYKRDSISVPPCTFDVLSLIYYCRTIDFGKYKDKDKIPINMVVEGKYYPLYLRYCGKETIKTHDGQKKYRCVKFTALLVPGTIFKGGEDMSIWVTDDENRIPILVQAKILIGSVKAYLDTTEGVSNEVKALLN